MCVTNILCAAGITSCILFTKGLKTNIRLPENKPFRNSVKSISRAFVFHGAVENYLKKITLKTPWGKKKNDRTYKINECSNTEKY